MPVPVSVVQEILDDAFLVALFHDGTEFPAAIGALASRSTTPSPTPEVDGEHLHQKTCLI